MGNLLFYLMIFHCIINCCCGDLHDFPNDKIFYQFHIKAEELSMFFDGVEGFLGGGEDLPGCLGFEIEVGDEVFHEDGIFVFLNFLVFE